MKNKNELNKEIIAVTLKIMEEFPELSKHLTEIPQHSNSNNLGKLKNQDLKDYLDSLNQIIDSYRKEHQVES